MARAELKPVFDFCEQNGFEINSNDPFQLTFTIKKKDVWDDVEFYQTSAGKIKKMDKDALFFIKANCGTIAYPSTESAYIEQLKKEAFERFGEIQDGDRFDCSSMGKGTCPITFKQGECDWTYIKEDDRLRKGYFDLYQSGKWATIANERIEVKFDGGNLQSRAFFFMYGKDAEHKMVDLGCFKVGEFLASQLEKYLNEEL